PAVAVGQHLQDDRAVALAAPGDRLVGGGLDRAHVHAVDALARNAVGGPALRQVGGGGGARQRRAHGVLVVLDDVDHGQAPELRHVEALVDLALVGGAVTEIGQRYVVVAAILVSEGESGADRHHGADNPGPAVELLLLGEHVHGAAFAVRIA